MRYVLAIFLTFVCCAPAYAQEDVALDNTLRAIASNHQGKLALFATDLRTGKTVSINADTPVPTASVIKLAVLFEALKQVEEGKLRLDEQLTMQKADQVGGSGVLSIIDAPHTMTVKDAISLMIDYSDNTATNLLINRLGLQNIDQRITALGLHNTWLYKLVFHPPVPPVPADQPKFGLGKTTAREMGTLIERYETCNLNDAGTTAPPTEQDRTLCKLAIDTLKQQTDNLGIQRYLNVPVANKTGALDEVRNDVGIVYAKGGPIVISAFTYDNKDQSWTPDNSNQVLIAKLARAIVDHWGSVDRGVRNQH